MSKTYQKAENEIVKLANQACEKYHPDLAKAGVKIAVLMVEPSRDKDDNPTAPAIMVAGQPVTAKIQLANARLRVLCGVDVVIDVDSERYHELTTAQAIALFDHELEHLVIEDGKTDDGRPKLMSKPDDISVTGFECVIKRHGEDALEAMAIKRVVDVCGQKLFPWAKEVAA